jgi:putative transposase
MQNMFAQIVTDRLRQEQQDALGRAPYQRTGDRRRRNGYKRTRLRGLFHKIVIRRPVMRGKTPPSPLLTMLKGLGNGVVALLASRFWLRGTSTRAVAEELNTTFGTKLTSSDVSTFSQTLLPDMRQWLQRPINYPVTYLFLDAAYLPVRKPGFTCKQALLCAVGITPEGKRRVLGFVLGDRENTDSWTALLKDLLQRGLDRSQLKLAISDEHKAIVAAVGDVLGVAHQLCVVHKMRNALVRVAARNRKAFYADFKAAFWADNAQQALLALGALRARWEAIYPKATAIACNNHEAFLRFQSQPKQLWTMLRSSNLIERFLREVRRRLRPAGTMHSEDELFKLLYGVSTAQEKRWDRRKLNYVKELKLAA